MNGWMVSHFAPFNGASANSSQIVAEHLKDLFHHAGSQKPTRYLFAETLPVSFAESWTVLEKRLRDSDVRGVIALGQAEGRKKICLERVALNWIDAKTPDSEGVQPVDLKIDEKGGELWTSLDVRKLLVEGVDISYSAGTYVCNYLYYRALQWAKAHRKQALFVHIPLLTTQNDPEFSDIFKMPNADAVNAVAEILRRLP